MIFVNSCGGIDSIGTPGWKIHRVNFHHYHVGGLAQASIPKLRASPSLQEGWLFHQPNSSTSQKLPSTQGGLVKLENYLAQTSKD
jgi:hypothetical protein